MQNLIHLSESHLRNVVNETIKRVINEKQINESLEIKNQWINRDKTAFIPGDKIHFIRSTTKKDRMDTKTGYFIGTVTSVEGDKVNFIEDKSRKKGNYVYNMRNLYYCLSWVGPLRSCFPSSLPDKEKEICVGYERLENGELSVVITHNQKKDEKGKNFDRVKNYYEYKVSYGPNETAKEIKKPETVNVVSTLSLAPGQNLPQTATESAIQKFGRVVIKPEWCTIVKKGNRTEYAVWDSKYGKEILTACPWLMYCDTWWKVPNLSEPKFVKGRQKN